MDNRVEIVLAAKNITGKAFKKVQTQLKSIGSAALSMNTAMVGAAGVAGLGYFIKKNLEAADVIAKTADTIGVSTTALQEYRFMAERSGVAVAQLDSGLGAFSKRLGELRMGTGALYTLLSKNNQALKDQLIAAGSTDQALAIFLDTLGKIENQSDKTALSAAAFSRTAGIKMTNLVKGGAKGLAEMRQEFSALGIAIDEKWLRQSEKAVDQFTNLEYAIKSRLMGAVVKAAPEVTKLVEDMAAWVVANDKFLTQDIPGHIKGMSKEVKAIKGLYDSVPKEIVGATGYGLVGTMLFGGSVGKIVAVIALLNNSLKITGNSFGDLIDKHYAAGNAIIKLYQSIEDALARTNHVVTGSIGPNTQGFGLYNKPGSEKNTNPEVIKPAIIIPPPALDHLTQAHRIAAETQAMIWKQAHEKRFEDTKKLYNKLHSLTGTETLKANEYQTEQARQLTAALDEQNQAIAEDWRATHEKKFADFKEMNDLAAYDQYQWSKRAVDLGKETADEWKNAFDGWASSFSGTLNDVLWGAETTFNDIARSFGKMITQMMIQKKVIEPFLNYNFGGGLTSIFSSIFHDGGIVGSGSGPGRSVPALAFTGAPRLHGGLMPDEFPAILQKGEGVFTQKQMSALGGGRNQAPVVQINLTNKSGQDVAAKQDGAAKWDGEKLILGVVLDAVARNRGGFKNNLRAAITG